MVFPAYVQLLFHMIGWYTYWLKFDLTFLVPVSLASINFVNQMMRNRMDSQKKEKVVEYCARTVSLSLNSLPLRDPTISGAVSE